jgi:Holliday junction DNA helicase RuvA
MIGRLSGLLIEKNPPQLLIDVSGVGYEVDVPMNTFYALPALGEPVTLLIHHVVREDGQFLYGFGSADERIAFRQLLKISGIGARIALAVLSGLSVADLHAAVAQQETGRLTKIPGIGKKIAERLLLELKGKLLTTAGGSGAVATDAAGSGKQNDDVLNALLALGYNEKEALFATRRLPPSLSTSDGIRQALKSLAKF